MYYLCIIKLNKMVEDIRLVLENLTWYDIIGGIFYILMIAGIITFMIVAIKEFKKYGY